MPSHYALSDAAIVFVTLWAARGLARQGQRLPAYAMACFGFAAAIGVLRFTMGLQLALAPAHAAASQIMGLAGGALLALTCLDRLPQSHAELKTGVTVIASGLVFFTAKPLLAPLFVLAALLAFIAATWRWRRADYSWLVPVGITLLIADNFLLRRAPWLSDAAGWHVYHLTIALALAATTAGLLRSLDVQRFWDFRAPPL